MDRRVSIIVPVYNVEKYVDKCLNSIMEQTYDNIEVIIVDDGSTDRSYDICKDICSRDKRFTLVTKNNGGLSSARNYGMRFCTCDLVTFIDSDDYVGVDYVKNLVYLLTKNNADIACTDYVLCYEDGSASGEKKKKEYEKIFDNNVAIADVLYQKHMQNSAWGKLYKTKLFDGISFPEGKLCEDLGTFYKLFEKSNKIVYSPFKDYYYLQRKTSIMGSGYNTNKLDGLAFCEEIFARYCEMKNKILISSARYRIVAECMYLLNIVPREEKKVIFSLRKKLKNNICGVLLDCNVGVSFKVKSLLYLIIKGKV